MKPRRLSSARRRGKSKMAAIGAAMRKLAHLGDDPEHEQADDQLESSHGGILLLRVEGVEPSILRDGGECSSRHPGR